MPRISPRISGILETALYVADLDRARAFYTALFGLETFMADDRMAALGVTPGQVLLLFRRGGSVADQPVPRAVGGFIPSHDASGRQHLCLAIPRQSLEEWAAHLRSSGIAIESRLDWPNGGTSLYFRDPDDHSIEVATSGLWPNS